MDLRELTVAELVALVRWLHDENERLRAEVAARDTSGTPPSVLPDSARFFATRELAK